MLTRDARAGSEALNVNGHVFSDGISFQLVDPNLASTFLGETLGSIPFSHTSAYRLHNAACEEGPERSPNSGRRETNGSLTAWMGLAAWPFLGVVCPPCG